MAGVLNGYVRQSGSDKASKLRLAESFHSSFMQMVIPLDASDQKLPFEGSLNDQKLLTVLDPLGHQYATGIVTRFATELLIVLVPSDKSKSNKYLQSLTTPMD